MREISSSEKIKGPEGPLIPPSREVGNEVSASQMRIEQQQLARVWI